MPWVPRVIYASLRVAKMRQYMSTTKRRWINHRNAELTEDSLLQGMFSFIDRLRFSNFAGEALVGLLAGKVVEIAVAQKNVHRLILRRAQLLRHFLPRTESRGHKDGVFADARARVSFPDESEPAECHSFVFPRRQRQRNQKKTAAAQTHAVRMPSLPLDHPKNGQNSFRAKSPARWSNHFK